MHGGMQEEFVTSGFTIELENVFELVPPLADFRPEDFRISTLPGFTNQNFHLKNTQHDWVLRIPKPETNQYLNRKYESHNANLANKLSIAPECVWRNETGLSLTMTLQNSKPLIKANLSNENNLNNLAATLGRLHKSRKKFKGTVNLEDLLHRYYKLIPKRLQNRIKPSYRMALRKLESLSVIENILVPSHNDLVLENILFDESEKIWFIDWEYASMASPYWDLATLCNAADFNQTKCAAFLDAYRKFNTNLDIEILFEYRYMLKLLSICWMAVFTTIDIEQEIEKLIV